MDTKNSNSVPIKESKLKTIGDDAFKKCQDLQTFTTDVKESKLETIGDDAFFSSDMRNVPALQVFGGSRKTYWKNQMNINKLKYINLTSKI